MSDPAVSDAVFGFHREIDPSLCVPCINFGVSLSKKKNLECIDEANIAFVSGSSLSIFNINTRKFSYIASISGNGIGCITVHPSRKLIAVGEIGLKPNIYVYSFPELEITKVLRGGTEISCSAMCFNKSGEVLASVGGNPDFMFTIWEWENEKILLHSKAFGQDIYGVKFSGEDSGRLTTCGTGHIKFWKMTKSFTGLKLQGITGKFGKAELSDVEAIAELRDGKVISGTETGLLLLWEGNMIKCQFMIQQDETNLIPCHDGLITYLDMNRDGRRIVSAGLDGWIREWDYHIIDEAEIDADKSMTYSLIPLDSYKIGDGISIKWMSRLPDANNDVFMILSSNGSIHRYSLQTRECQLILNLHSSSISGLACSPSELLVSTCCLDGRVLLWDLMTRELVSSSKYSSGATCITWVPQKLVENNRVVAVGFQDGVVRILQQICSVPQDTAGGDGNRWKLLEAFKPHNENVSSISYSPSGNILATGCVNGQIFMFHPMISSELKVQHVPRAMVDLKCSISKFDWNSKESALLATCSQSGCQLIEIPLMDSVSQCSSLVDDDDSRLSRASSRVSSDAYDLDAEPVPIHVRDLDLNDYMPVKEALETLEIMSKDTVESLKKQNASDEESKTDVDECLLFETSAKKNCGMLINTFSNIKFAPLLAHAIYIANKESKDSILASGSSVMSCSIANESKSKSNDIVTKNMNLVAKVVDKSTTKSQIYMLNKDCDGAFVAAKFCLLEGAANQTSSLSIDKLNITSLERSISKGFIIVGLNNGQVCVMPSSYTNSFIRVLNQDGLCGSISSASMSFDDRYLVSCSTDGILSVAELSVIKILDAAKNIEQMAVNVEERRRRNIARSLADFVMKERIIPSLAPTDPSNQREDEECKPEKAFVMLQDNAGTSFKAASVWYHGDIKLKTSFKMPTSEEVNNELNLQEGSDITDSNAYSIHEAKARTEQEDRMVLAKKRRDKMKDSVTSLRREFSKLRKENEMLPDNFKIEFESAEFVVDPELRDIINRDISDRLDSIRMEKEYELELSQVKLRKLKNAYLNTEVVEGFSVSSFRRGIQVRSLRCNEMSKELSEFFVTIVDNLKREGLMEMQKEIIRSEEASRASSPSQNLGSSTSKNDDDSEKAGESIQECQESGKNDCSFANRKRLRDARRIDITQHDLKKPSEDQDDIIDIESLNEAHKTAGNFVLKISDEYEVPEDQRVNTGKKRQQLAMLEEAVFSTKMQFNQRLLSFRTSKKTIIDRVKEIEKQIHDLDRQLESGQLTAIFNVNIDSQEWPDDRDEVTVHDLEQYKHSGYKKAPKNSIVTDMKTKLVRDEFSGIYRKLSKQEIADLNKVESVSLLSTSLLTNELKGKFKRPINPTTHHLMSSLPHVASMTSSTSCNHGASKKVSEERERRLSMERLKLLKDIEDMMNQFDDGLMELRSQMFVLMGETKSAESKAIVLLSEYEMLCAFEDKDESLHQRQIRHQKEILEVERTIRDGDEKITSKMDSIVVYETQIADLFRKFDEMVPEVDPNRPKFFKAFKKKIRRVKMIINEDGEEVEDEEDDMDELDDDDEIEDIGDVCPPDLDDVLFAKIMLMREERQTIDEAMQEDIKTLDEVKKASERLKTRLKQLSKDALNNESEIKRLQLDKLRKMSRIRITVPLQFNQLYCMNNSGTSTLDSVLKREEEKQDGSVSEYSSPFQLESDISMTSHILIASNEIKRLCKRIVDLKDEFKTQNSIFKRLKREHVAIDKQRISLNSEINDIMKKSEEIQILKFGQLVDIEQVDRAISSTGESDIDRRISELETSKEFLIERANQQINKVQENLSKTLEDNTSLYQQIGQLKRRQFTVEGFLRENGSDVGGHEGPVIKQEIEDRSQLVGLVKLQSREIEAIKAEISLLKRKGGPTFIPALNQPRMRQQSEESL